PLPTVDTGVPCARPGTLSAVVNTVTGVSEQSGELHRFELEPDVRDWLDSLTDSDFQAGRRGAACSRRRAPALAGPWSDHLEGPVWEVGRRPLGAGPRPRSVDGPGNDLAARFSRDGAHAEWFYGFR